MSMRYATITESSRQESLSSARVRNLLFGVLAAVAASCAPHSTPAPRAAATGAVRFSHVLAAPLSLRERGALGRDLDRIFAPYLGASISLCVIDTSGAPAYARRCDRAVVAASSQKIIVAAAALRYLGAAYRFHTQLAAAAPVTDGALASDLWLIGSGDPVLTSEDLRGGVKIVASGGLEHIDGIVRVDASALSGPERNPLWDPADANSGFAAATSGISVDQDTVEFHVHPGAPGSAARIELKPRSSLVTYSGNVLTVPAGYSSYVTINPTANQNAFVVQGKIAASEPEAVYFLPVSRIPNYAGDVVESMLEERNVATRGRSGTGMAPVGLHALWDHRSPPLRFIVSKMLYESNNHIAEQLLRKIGHAQSGIGDDAHGAAAEYAYLRSAGVPIPSLRLVDGSGLADSNRVAAVTLGTLLARAELTPGGNQLYLALPRGGIEGTLRHYHFSTARGRVRAKSGHLTSVEALAGYVSTRRHGRIVFAFLIDTGASGAQVDETIARAVDRLAEF